MLLDKQGLGAAKLARESKLSYNVVMYHLRLLKTEGTVERHGDRRYVWMPTGTGQTRLN
jgi:DNA-binding IclR family transcriptional regulator